MKKLLFSVFTIMAILSCSKNNPKLLQLPVNGKIMDAYFHTTDSSFIMVVISNKKDSTGIFSFTDLRFYQVKDSIPILKYKYTSENIWISTFRKNYFIFSDRKMSRNLILTQNMKTLWSSDKLIDALSDNYLYVYKVNTFYVLNLENSDTLWKQEHFTPNLVTEKQDKVFGRHNDELQLRDIKNGELFWSININDLKLTGYPYYYTFGNTILITDTDKIVCLNLENAEVLWEYSLKIKPSRFGLVYWSKNYSDTNYLYLQANDKLHFIDFKEQKMKFVCDINQESQQRPIVVNDYVYYVDHRKLYRFRHNEFDKKETIFENEETFDCCITKTGYVYQLRNGKTYYKTYPK